MYILETFNWYFFSNSVDFFEKCFDIELGKDFIQKLGMNPFLKTIESYFPFKYKKLAYISRWKEQIVMQESFYIG